jgi:hypothetical protein
MIPNLLACIAQVWKFLLGYYPYESTRSERKALQAEKAKEYEVLKAQWQSVSEDQVGFLGPALLFVTLSLSRPIAAGNFKIVSPLLSSTLNEEVSNLLDIERVCKDFGDRSCSVTVGFPKAKRGRLGSLPPDFREPGGSEPLKSGGSEPTHPVPSRYPTQSKQHEEADSETDALFLPNLPLSDRAIGQHRDHAAF